MAPPPPAAATTADPHYRFQHSPRTQSLTPDGAIAAASAALADHHQAATHDDHACLGDDCFVAQNDEENQALCECLLDNLLERIARRDPDQKLFLQAFEEVARDLPSRCNRITSTCSRRSRSRSRCTTSVCRGWTTADGSR